MKIRLFLYIVLLFSGTIGLSAQAAREGAFIMIPESTNAYFYDGTYISGVSLMSENGAKGCPYISAFGDVYVCVDTVYDILADESEKETYLYDRENASLTLRLNGKKAVLPVGKKFMIRSDENAESMFVYEIGGSLYVPARVISMMCGGDVLYNEECGYIALFTDNGLKAEVVSEDGSLKEEFEGRLSYNPGMNNLSGNNKYLMPDLDTVTEVPDAECVFRVGTEVFYVNDYKLYSMVGEKTGQIVFKSRSGETQEIYVSSAIAAEGRIYGIAATHKGGKAGRVFVCDYDGTGFMYINNLPVMGLFKQTAGNRDWIYYISAGRESKIYMYDVSGGDEYELIIQNKDGKNAIGTSERFGIMSNGVFTVEADKKSVTLIRFERPLYECEWVKIRSDRKIRKIDKYSSGEAFSEIVCVNYDVDNGYIYIVDKKDAVYRLLTISAFNSTVEIVKEYTDEVVNVCLFKGVNGDKLYVEGDGKTLDIITPKKR